MARCFYSKSWKQLINTVLADAKSAYSYKDIELLPATMQFVVARGCHKNSEYAKNIANEYIHYLKDSSQSAEESELWNCLISIPVNTYLTTNYSLELEKAWGSVSSLKAFYNMQCRTKTVSDIGVRHRLYQCSEVYNNNSLNTIWHIHGDISAPRSMLFDHYAYGKQQYQINKYLQNFFSRYNKSQKDHDSYKPLSWIDYFMIGNVYVIGFGIYPCEQDLWWLLACKKKSFPDTQFLLFAPEDGLSGDVKKMLIAYGYTPETQFEVKNNDYVKCYKSMMDEISKRIRNE